MGYFSEVHMCSDSHTLIREVPFLSRLLVLVNYVNTQCFRLILVRRAFEEI